MEKKIPLPKRIFEEIWASYDLRCYIGREDECIYDLPGNFLGVNIGDVVGLFVTGKQDTFRKITAAVISPDPIRIRILNTTKAKA